eukprot:CAMPEP_0167746932 /NCGR_PEP_ID=MMETSP0110_2-20121227/3989_1 /TAXON_ID=629695 /ORGANISM="Gymnochlora sp., Strain CCMP2014" /LENGTH=569 /DNA_ID=CAMNT_0007631755 /DNA_START=18 /DNA_END=1727 /DNA_ORIENTATION=-
MLRSDDVDKGTKRTEHENRFDRQLRLWGAHGQDAIEETYLCALGAGPAIAETLKNLVLPNIQMITIVEDGKVTDEDIGNNFFVSKDDLGKDKGKTVLENLLEMNPWDEKEKFGVKGFHIKKNPDKMIESDLSAFLKYDIIIASEISEKSMLKLSDFCYANNIAFVTLQVNGMVGYVRWSKAEHVVEESHPIGDTSDVRLYPDQLAIFPELKKFLEEYDFKELRKSSYVYKHTPWPIILNKKISEWIKMKGSLPKSFDDKSEFKKTLRDTVENRTADRSNSYNLMEAYRNAHKAYNKPEPTEDAAVVLSDAKAKTVTKKSSKFWIVMNAVNIFKSKEGNGFLPVSSNIPDMTSLPQTYITLKKLYQEQEKKDIAVVKSNVKKLLESIGKDSKEISESYIERMVKVIRTVAMIRNKPISNEYDAKKIDSENITDIFQEWEETPPVPEGEDPPPPVPKNIYWYFALRAAERFRTKYGRYPGQPLDCDYEKDVSEMTKIQAQMFEEYKIEAKVEPSVIREITRYGGKQVHNIASYIGGVASQLCLKLIIKQFVPLHNTFVYNGIRSSANVYEL